MCVCVRVRVRVRVHVHVVVIAWYMMWFTTATYRLLVGSDQSSD